MERAFARQDSDGVLRLRYSVMARTPLGPRLIAAAIPSRFENLSKMQQALGVSYSTAHKWAKGTATPDWEHVELLAELLEVDPADLVREKPLPISLRSHPEWSVACARVRERWPGRVSEQALQQTGDLPLSHLPEHVDEVLVIDVASVIDRYFSEKNSGA
jgi:hypothetical protein